MDINSPQVKQFCDTQIRSTASVFGQLYHSAKRVLEIWDAQGLADVIPNTDDVIPDGAATDGRPVITGAMVHAYIGGLQTYVQTLEANTDAVLNLVLKVAPNP